MISTAVIIAGGLGTRLHPLTLEIPKPLIPIRGTTLTEHVISKLKEAGVKKVYLSIGYLSEKIIKHFSIHDLGIEIEFLIEQQPLGTGGWLKLLTQEQISKDFKEDFIVVNGDNLFDLNWEAMHDLHKTNNSLITIALKEVEEVSHLGVVRLEENKILEFVEKPPKGLEPSNFINSGYYIFSPLIFNILPSETKIMFEKNLFPKIASLNKLFGYKDNSQWFDTGTFERWHEVIKNWKV
ncbi:MAG: nucleotidyltransferase family protein [Nanoarchaeota archaeon]|nr:nucleotidyltransferase family protein [Nanoarchaeota archaeon]